VRIVEPAVDHVRAGTDVGRDRGLGPDVLPAFVVDAHFHAEFFAEAFGVGHERDFVTLDETFPAQHAQFGAFLWLQVQGRHRCGCRLGGCLLVLRQDLAGNGAGSETGRHLQEIATIDIAHLNLLWLLLQSRPA